MALVRVGHPLAVPAEVIAPGVRFASKTTARGELPFGFGGQPLACPPRIRLCIFVCDLYDRVIVLANDAAFRPGRMPPVRAMHIAPPLEMVVQRNGMIGWREHDRAGDQIFSRRVGEVFLTRLALCDCQVASCLHVLSEFYVSYVCLIHEEAVHVDAMNGSRVPSGSHAYFVFARRI